MSTKLNLSSKAFPARIAELGFTANLPADWVNHELPAEDVDFSNPTLFVPLAVVTAPHAAIVYAFAARPAYEDGTLHDWAMYFLQHNQLQPRTIGRSEVASVPAVVGEAIQASDMGPMLVRFVFLEDGNRLVNISLTAPEMLADTMQEAWFDLLRSFKLETPRGSRFKSEANADIMPAPSAAATETEPPSSLGNSNQTASKVHNTPDIRDSETGEPLLPLRRDFPLPDGSESKRTRMYDFALSDDSMSLDDDQEMNARLVKNGVGLIPNIAGLSDTDRTATLAAGAILAEFNVPYGWHVLDDGKRTLVFEPSGKVQISLNLIPYEGRDRQAILDELESQARKDYPHPEFIRLNEGKIEALGVRNIADGKQPLEQYHMLYPHSDETMVLRARVTTTPDQSTNACNLAELILNSCVFPEVEQEVQPQEEPRSGSSDESGEVESAPPQPAARSDGLPKWWLQAVALEAENKLAEAEEVIRTGCQHMAFAHATADMYRLRMLRLKAAGDANGALEAFKKSSDFIWHYASMATSGGEGAALSLERDEFRARLVAEYGRDPEAK